ncbi:MAG: M23 family metallopeptidase [Bryobacterales bacterium]|nr:M23 family metallopeptidase [Bryobacterales bacterium]
MKRNYFIVVLAHPIHGRLRRLHIPHYALHVAVSLVVLAAIAGIGFVSSYSRMLGKVSEFNQLRTEKVALQARYDDLRARVEENDVQIASLGDLASEVSIAFGIRRDFEGTGSGAGDDIAESDPDPRRQYDFLREVRTPSRAGASMLSWLSNTTPSIWPVPGRINSPFGRRIDPFHGGGGFHPGIDLSAASGTPVVATADGVVTSAGWLGGYGNRVQISHGKNGLSTVYAHLTEIFATPGQVVRRGEVVGRAGSTGRSTSAHLHYEVRYRGTQVNPYKYLRHSDAQTAGLIAAD